MEKILINFSYEPDVMDLDCFIFHDEFTEGQIDVIYNLLFNMMIDVLDDLTTGIEDYDALNFITHSILYDFKYLSDVLEFDPDYFNVALNKFEYETVPFMCRVYEDGNELGITFDKKIGTFDLLVAVIILCHQVFDEYMVRAFLLDVTLSYPLMNFEMEDDYPHEFES